MAITLEQIHEDLTGLKREMQEIKSLLVEELELSSDVIKEIQESRERREDEFVSNEDMQKEFS